MDRRIDIRLPKDEHETLKAYAKRKGRTVSDVLREMIRNLAKGKS
jgi:predicted DNA-binding protein